MRGGLLGAGLELQCMRRKEIVMVTTTNSPVPVKITGRQRLTVLLLLGTGFMLSADFSILNVALPELGAGVGLRVSELPWVISAYALPAAGFTLLFGRTRGPLTLLDAFEGRRQLIAYYLMWHTGHPAAEQCEGCTWVTTQVSELSYLQLRADGPHRVRTPGAVGRLAPRLAATVLHHPD